MVSTSFKSIELSAGWRVKQTDTDDWLPVDRVPTTVHADLLANGRIPDPTIDRNERLSQWVAEKPWTYETTLPLDVLDDAVDDLTIDDHIDSDDINEHNEQRQTSTRCRHPNRTRRYILAFAGLDTFVSIYLNNTLLATSSNMWIPLRIDITSQLQDLHHETLQSEQQPKQQPKQQPTLRLVFASPLLTARALKAAHPSHAWIASNGDPSRLAARKAQYHWGWDWGPVQATCGPYRPVALERYVAKIVEVGVRYWLDEGLGVVTGRVVVAVEGGEGVVGILGGKLGEETGKMGAGLDVEFSVRDAQGQTVVCERVEVVDGAAQLDFRVQSPQLWWPAGYGAQSMYAVSATLRQEDQELHSESRRVGFRRVELVQEEDGLGRSFYFRVNGVDVFAGGANWIPADMDLSRVTGSKYRELLLRAREANMVMIRVWGGGTYEHPACYEAADELGLMIWQDFMFACGNYPCHASFLESVTKEAEVQVQRLEQHPCVVLFCGNNEDYQIAEDEVGYRYDDNDPESWIKSKFPARWIYEKLLPETVARLSPTTPYHPGSPFSPPSTSSCKPTKSSDPSTGDIHQWNIYHGSQDPYQSYPSQGGRFVSEFGMPSLSCLSTIKTSITDEKELRPGSRTLEWHNKAGKGEGILASYVADNLGPALPSRSGFSRNSNSDETLHESERSTNDNQACSAMLDLEKWTYATQLCQAEAMAFALRGWRRQWSGSAHTKKEISKDLKAATRPTGGALVWQLNDVWPATSWSIIDAASRLKPAYWTIKRALAPISMGISRTDDNWRAGHVTTADEVDYVVWIATDPRFLGTSGQITSSLSRGSPVASDKVRHDTSRSRSTSARVEITFWTESEGTRHETYEVKLAVNGTTEVCCGRMPSTPDCVIGARVFIDDELVAREVCWPQPLKYFDFGGDRGLNVVRKSVACSTDDDDSELGDGRQRNDTALHVSTQCPVKGLVFSAGDWVAFEDNCLDVMPGDEQVVICGGLGQEDELKWRYYG